MPVASSRARISPSYTDSIDFTRDLPIPFACVATNIIDNSEYDFHSGHLPQAMRASMAIPAAFSPVRIGDMVLVDGGLRNNFPADIARQMGADIIIGVTVQGPPKVAENLGGTMSIISQIVDVNCKNKYDENLAITDLHFPVDTKGFNAASFTPAAIDTLIRRGEEEAMRHWDQILALKKRIGIDDSFRPTILQPLRPQVLTEKRHVTGFTFENMTAQDERFIRQKHHLNKLDSIDAKLQQMPEPALTQRSMPPYRSDSTFLGRLSSPSVPNSQCDWASVSWAAWKLRGTRVISHALSSVIPSIAMTSMCI